MAERGNGTGATRGRQWKTDMATKSKHQLSEDEFQMIQKYSQQEFFNFVVRQKFQFHMIAHRMYDTITQVLDRKIVLVVNDSSFNYLKIRMNRLKHY